MSEQQTFLDGRVVLHAGDCREVLLGMPDNSVDSVVTDPPYHLTSIVKRFAKFNQKDVDRNFVDRKIDGQGTSPFARSARGFMGKQWDGGDIAFQPELWAEVLRVLKPGGYILAFSGCRTYHRMACAIEDAGFITHPMFAWCFSSGFPKAHNLSKQLDKLVGAERKIVGHQKLTGTARTLSGNKSTHGDWQHGARNIESAPITAPATDAAREWDGWFYGTQSCKPSYEPVFCGQKPFTNQQYISIIGSNLSRLWRQLWSSLSASVAAQNSHLRHIMRGEAKDISAPKNVYTKDVSFAQMDMSQLESATISSLNTVSSWNGIWDECSVQESTSIIETELSTITTLATLSCLVSKITPESIILDHKEGAGLTVHASHAAQFFNGFVAKLKITLELSALANVIAKEPISFPVAPANRPNIEPVYFGQKPFERGLNGAQNVLKFGVGAINVGACKVGPVVDNRRPKGAVENAFPHSDDSWRSHIDEGGAVSARWPANLITDGSDEVLACFPETATGNFSGHRNEPKTNGIYGEFEFQNERGHVGDSGSAARFFYTAKADADDRLGSKHPTVKPIDLIQYLVRLITPKCGVCLDLFAGTGVTAEACFREGFRSILIEREPEYISDIDRRMALVMEGPDTRAYASMKARNRPRDDGPLFGGMDGRGERFVGSDGVARRRKEPLPNWQDEASE